MLVIRPILRSDFDGLKQIAIDSGSGFTSLPVDDERLAEKIDHSVHSITSTIEERGEEGYLFVLEDTATGKIVGTTAIEASVGLTTPMYHYHITSQVHVSRALNSTMRQQLLTMCNDYTGCSEICTLFLREQYRKGLAGRFLSRIRFAFMADQSSRFSDTVIAEMRGVSDAQGHSPFWQWLQEHFFSIEFPQADHLVGLGDKANNATHGGLGKFGQGFQNQIAGACSARRLQQIAHASNITQPSSRVSLHLLLSLPVSHYINLSLPVSHHVPLSPHVSHHRYIIFCVYFYVCSHRTSVFLGIRSESRETGCISTSNFVIQLGADIFVPNA